MVEYITRTQTACAVGATELIDLFDDKTPGAILAPDSGIQEIRVVGQLLFNTANEEIMCGVKLTGDGIVGGPIRILSHAGVIGAMGTGEDAELGMTPVSIPVQITTLPGKAIRIWGLVAGTASVTADMGVTLVSGGSGGVTYLTRELAAAGDPSSGLETELTSNFDDSAPGRYTVPPGISRIAEIRGVHTVIGDAADEGAMAGIRLQGATVGQVDIVVGSSGMGTAGTGQASPYMLPSFLHAVDIPLTSGKDLQILGTTEGAAAADSRFGFTLSLV